MSEVIQGDLSIDSSWKIGVVTSRFNEVVTEPLEQGAVNRLKELGLQECQLTVVRVPGAVEIPLAAKVLLESGCNGVLALGAVIRGETSHYDYVCNAVERGCSELQLQYGRPVAFGVLTTENRDQALARVGGAKGHKGAEAAEVTIEMLNFMKRVL